MTTIDRKTNDLKAFISNWRANNPGIPDKELEGSNLEKFVKDLQTKIKETTSFDHQTGSKLILYSGLTQSQTPMYEEVDKFCKNNSDYYYISSTEAGQVLWDKGIMEAIKDTIKNDTVTERVLSGKSFDASTKKPGTRISKYINADKKYLSMDDFISKRLTHEAVTKNKDIIYVAGENVTATDKKVGTETELPYIISEIWMYKNVNDVKNHNLIVVKDVNDIPKNNLDTIRGKNIEDIQFHFDENGTVRNVELKIKNFPPAKTAFPEGPLISLNLKDIEKLPSDSDMKEIYNKYDSMDPSAKFLLKNAELKGHLEVPKDKYSYLEKIKHSLNMDFKGTQLQNGNYNVVYNKDQKDKIADALNTKSISNLDANTMMKLKAFDKIAAPKMQIFSIVSDNSVVFPKNMEQTMNNLIQRIQNIQKSCNSAGNITVNLATIDETIGKPKESNEPKLNTSQAKRRHSI